MAPPLISMPSLISKIRAPSRRLSIPVSASSLKASLCCKTRTIACSGLGENLEKNRSMLLDALADAPTPTISGDLGWGFSSCSDWLVSTMLRFPALASALPNDGHDQIACMFDRTVEIREFGRAL